ncbi:hypothetical protein HGRIS_001233 [Hohenbuehelia grisea]|uniref:Uncharacterized protein n=1 Tax=Hohenbuehelia grisea TaxID=104357 RepID=A0ABR3JNW1_9AGAR
MTTFSPTCEIFYVRDIAQLRARASVLLQTTPPNTFLSGSCRKEAAQEARLAQNPEQAEGAQRRRDFMEKRMGQKPAAPPGPVITQAELAGKVGSFSIFYEVWKSNAAGSIDKTLGKSCTPHPENITMLGDCHSITSRAYHKGDEPTLTDKHLSNLQLDETELRVQGNVAFPPKDPGLTIRQWYNKYNAPETREAYVKTPKGMTKGTSFSVE